MTAPEPASPRSAAVQAARRLARAPERRRTGRFLVEGPQPVAAALAAGHPVHDLFVTAAARDRHAGLVGTAGRAGARLHLVSEPVLRALAGTVTPQGVVAVTDTVPVEPAAALAGRPRLVVVLVAVADPGNVGTVLRTADAAGADAVLLTAGSADVHNGKAVRASAGSLFHLPVAVQLPADAAVSAVRSAGLAVVTTDAAAGVDLYSLADDGTLAGPTAWVFGNEAHGLPAEVRAGADVTARVPMRGRAESLNLAAAAAVCLFASARAHRATPGPAAH